MDSCVGGVDWLAAGCYFFALASAAVTEKINAPWLPWWRRYLSCWGLALEVTVALAGRRVPWFLIFGTIGALYWNIWTAHRNRRGGRRGKPAPSLGAMLTAVQQAAFRREATAT